MQLLLRYFVVLCTFIGAGADFLVPGPFRNLAVSDVSVGQTCVEEFACRSFDSSTCLAQGVCSVMQDCNGREDLPGLEHPLIDWQSGQQDNSINNRAGAGAVDSPGCTVVNERPQNPPPVTFPPSDARTLLVNGSEADLSPCYTQRTEAVNSSFSLVFWLKADCRNCSVLEIPQTTGESIHLRVVESSLCITSDCAAVLTKGQWRLITVRAFNNEIEIFSGSNQVTFPGSNLDNLTIENLYIGSSEIIPMADMFELFDVRFYNDALTSREINDLTTGMSDPTLEFPDCRCPSSHPDINDADSELCTDGVSQVLRYNTTVHFNPPEVMLDGDAQTRWASSDQGTITLALDLERPYEIESIKVSFASALPSRVECTFVSDGKDMQTRLFVCAGSECNLSLTPLDASGTVGEFRNHVAEAIKISMHRVGSTTAESFVISDIAVSGRCDCQGNAQSCTYSQTGDYTCSCNASTNTRDSSCGTCKLNFYRSPDQFGCPHACTCNLAGVANANDMCDQATGVCKCRANVEGVSCDTCKHFTYNLVSSNPDGCSPCNCNQTGSTSCSNTTGECFCRDNTVSDRCDQCAGDSFSFSGSLDCQPCACVTAGTISQRTDCTGSGQCPCKQNVMGLKCGQCKSGYYSLSSTNTDGCQTCACHPVGSEHAACDTQNGQCPCRGGDITDISCTPVVTSIDPAFGPEIGGTLITVHGRLLGNDSGSVSVLLGDIPQPVVSVDDTTLVFNTMQYNGSDASGSKAPTLELQWSGASGPMGVPLNFQYLPNPVFDMSRNTRVTTYRRGGCHVHVYGSNLKSVLYPRTEFTNSASPGRVIYGTCDHTPDHIMCVTPDITSLSATSGSNQYQMRVMLDGLTTARDITVLPDPKINDAGKIRFQYPFEDTVGLSGTNLKSSCKVKVYIGVVSCEIKSLSDTGIEFAPPASPPGGGKKHTIEVHVGDTKMEVGTLQYLELYETTNFIIIVSCIGGFIILVFIVVIVCCCCRIRRNHAPPSAKMSNGANDKQMVEVDHRPMNNYSELVTLVDAPDMPATRNGHNNGLVRMETVVKEHKKGIVNTEAEDSILVEEFLPRVEPGVRDEVKRCYVGNGHFVPGRACFIRGRHTQLVDGTLQKNGVPVQKLSIKSVIDSLTGHELPTWANLALSECLRLRRFKHNHILNIIGIGANQKQFHILYPNMAQGILKAVVSDTSKDFSVRQLLGFSQQVAEGIDFLSSKDITHKDVAARNCMVDEHSVVKLSDASFSWDLYPDEYVYDQSRERYLPIRWMAPESLQDGYYDMRTDVWSFAVLVWELLTRGCLPFHEVTDSTGVSEYILQGYILGRPDTLSVDVYELLRSCWSPENESRPSIANVSRTLSEILEADDDDETYANAGELASFDQQRSSGMAASPRHHNGGGNFYSTTNLSQV